MGITKIEWTASYDKNGILQPGYTFNPWHGCTHSGSRGCDSCYAKRLSKRFGHDIWGPKAPRRFMSDAYWKKPLAWNKKAQKAGVRARVFCGSMCDVLEYHTNKKIRIDMAVERWKLWHLIHKTPWLKWLLLTKRIDGLVHVPYSWTEIEWPANVRLGITVVNQEEADRDISKLLKLNVPNFLSIEPMLEPINLGLFGTIPNSKPYSLVYEKLNWIIVGAETGPGARPMHLDWARSIRDQCQIAGVPFFFKAASKGMEIPDDLKIQQFPKEKVPCP